MTAQQRPVVDDLGNITVHGRSGLVIVVKVETETSGVYEDISASDLFFEIGGKLRLALSAGADIYSRQVILTRAQVATLSIGQPYAFAIHDETPTTPSTPWAGTITTFGFKTAPSGVADVDGEAANWSGATVVIQPGGGSPVVVVNYMGQPGEGIPIGGTAGQYLRKSSSTDYAVGWDTLTADDVSGLSDALTALGAADTSLTSRLSTEETARATADASLATAVAATYLPLAGGVMAGVLAFVAGTAALPGLAVAGDLNTGIYAPAADTLAVTAGGVGRWAWDANGHYYPLVDGGGDLGGGSNRIRDGWFSRNVSVGTGITVGYSTTSSAQLHVGAGATVTYANGIGTAATSQVINAQTSGSAAVTVAVVNGYNNRRASLFVDQDNAVWGLSSLYSSGTIPFIIWQNGAEQLRLDTSGRLGLGVVPTSFLHVAGATGATLNLAFEPAGWLGLKHRVGPQYRGDGLVSSVNVRLTSLTAGTLDDATNSGAGLVLLADGSLSLVTATAGSGVRTFAPTFGISSAGVATLYNNLLAGADATYDLGASGASRFRDAHLSRNIVVGGLVQFGGTSNLFPAWARSGTQLRARIADDSNYTSVRASYYAFPGGQLIDSNSTDQFIFQNNGATALAYLAVEANNTLALRNGANAQALRVYNSTDGTNLERLNFEWTGGFARIGTSAAGTGITRILAFGVAGATNWYISTAGNWLAGADNTYDIGANGSNRVRNVWTASGVYSPNFNFTSGGGTARGSISSATDGIFSFYNGAGTGFTGIKMGGVTASQPYLKVNGANLQGRLADDTDFNRFQAKLQTHANAVAETPTATHTLTLYDAAGTPYKVLAVAA